MSTDQRNTWADLSPELLELIFQRLTLMDYFKCREICSSWRKAVNDALATKGRCPPLSQLPFLLILSRNNPFKLMSLTQHRVLTMSTQSCVDLTDDLTQEVHSVVQGWLMFNRVYYRDEKKQLRYEFSFFNPVSLARFKLPTLSLFSRPCSCYGRTAFDSTPDSPEFRVVFLISYIPMGQNNLKQRLACCKVSHESWTTIIETDDTGTNLFHDIAMHDRKLYALTRTTNIRHSVIVFSLGDTDTNAAIMVERLVLLDPSPFPGGMLAMDSSRGELLLIDRLRERIRNTDTRKCSYSYLTSGFRVFKLDLSGPRWSEIKDLGDRFLFVDWNGARVISARDLDGAEEFEWGNCIFFCNTSCADEISKYDSGVFSLADKSVKRLASSSSLPPACFNSPAMWFSPRPW